MRDLPLESGAKAPEPWLPVVGWFVLMAAAYELPSTDLDHLGELTSYEVVRRVRANGNRDY